MNPPDENKETLRTSRRKMTLLALESKEHELSPNEGAVGKGGDANVGKGDGVLGAGLDPGLQGMAGARAGKEVATGRAAWQVKLVIVA